MRLICLMLLLAPAVFAQTTQPEPGSTDTTQSLSSRRIVLDIFENKVEVERIAIPDFNVTAPTQAFNEARQQLMDVLRADIINSGYLDLIDLSRFAGLGDPHSGPVDFAKWASVEANHLVLGSITPQGDQMRIEVRLYDIAAKKHVLAKAYRGLPKLARKMGHVVADDILYRLRGIKFATSKIVFTREANQTGAKPKFLKELFIMDYDGYDPLPITRGGISFSPSACQVGKDTMLAYSVFERPGSLNAAYNIYFKPTLLSRPKPILSGSDQRATSPAISPDGRKVAFAMTKEGNVDIYVMRLDGSDLVRLTRHPHVDTNPSWSPGGNAILFTSGRTGAPQIYQMDADGLNQRRITYENPYNDSAVWNPVHDSIAYVSRFENDFDIYVMNIKDGKNYRVTSKQGSNEEPCWSPDGNQLAFTSNRSGKWQIYVVNINGMNLRQVTHSGNNRNPVWIKGK